MRTLATAVMSTALLLPGVAVPADAPLPDELQCTLASGQKCTEGGCAAIDHAERITLPMKVGVELSAGVIAGTGADGWPMVSRVVSLVREPGQLVLQGVGYGVGWTMAIEFPGSRAMATMTAADGMAVLLGTCAAAQP